MEHLLSAWPAVYRYLERAGRILLLTDYDGTLTRIVERPELARLPDRVKNILELLSHRGDITVGVVSGRALSDLRSRVGISGLVYAGNHGLEIEGPGVSFVSPLAAELRPVLRVIHFVLSRALSRVKGVLVEDKGLSLSVHFRMVDPKHTPEVEDIVKKTVGPAQAAGKARLTSGKMVHEIRPAVDWNKGKAIRLLMKRYGKGGRRSGLVPIYLGDDATDEDAFRVIEAYGNGISGFVGPAGTRSAARYYLKSPEEVGQFLETLVNADGLCSMSAAGSAAGLPTYPDSEDPQMRTSVGYTPVTASFETSSWRTPWAR